MFKQSLKLWTSVNHISSLLKCPTYCTQTNVKHKWDLLSAVCVERHPLISTPKSKIEEAYQDLLNQIEFEQSFLCDHELKIQAELETKEKLKKGLNILDPDDVSIEKASDIEDKGDAELEAFKFSPRITEADTKNIQTSLERKLDKPLLLVVQQQVGDKLFWLPPQGVRQEGENMRQTADRVLKTLCGDNVNIKIYGNAPVGFYKYAYPRPMRETGKFGAKIFYYIGKYIDGEVSNTAKYLWLDRQELADNLPKPIHKSVSKFLIPEQTLDY
ncbi:39S ribosomal protein L46, mitochondrial [Chelonus insularis]|uniref:39S ribosomal protein L46, mitochondrial n=1 Tax=Chelonus insularis TaxID=460826 RepID=UPI00158A4148|nr:39S ribosomal protein L46, mitochondrial [Chelonus insularis]